MSIPMVVVAVAVLLALAGYFVARSRPAAEVESFFYFRCQECNRKLRCPARKAGRKVMCPQCKQRWRLPDAAPLTSVSPGTFLR
jgi:hypothetical protein